MKSTTIYIWSHGIDGDWIGYPNGDAAEFASVDDALAFADDAFIAQLLAMGIDPDQVVLGAYDTTTH